MQVILKNIIFYMFPNIHYIHIAGTCKGYDGLWLRINVKKSKRLTLLHWNCDTIRRIYHFVYEATVFKILSLHCEYII